jgi:hypothetical protein
MDSIISFTSLSSSMETTPLPEIAGHGTTYNFSSNSVEIMCREAKNIPASSSYLVDQELNLTLDYHYLRILFFVVAAVVADAVGIVVLAVLVVHVEFL